ncbi:A-kinase anchor protein 9 isoform X2 [Engraulis encrasicolus]|uniref:A-kinase anchor protein 9 isoform X2 n=1 Tax=Engraulis encrasicolus TaxID=184585 RepID=UPI002FD6B640
MEDEERQRKLEAGKAKLAEYRQRKAQSDGQKKQKKKKKKKDADEEGTRDEAGEQEEGGGGGAPPHTEFTFARTLRRGETVKHDQHYTIEPESEVSTTAEDYSTEVNGCVETTEKAMEAPGLLIWEEDLRQSVVTPSDQDPDQDPDPDPDQDLLLGSPPLGSSPPPRPPPVRERGLGRRQGDMEEELAAKTQALEDLTRELEDIRAAYGTEGVQQLQEFEAALKQRDGIITQLTSNLQLARKEKDEVMREFLELTDQSQKLKIQFQQLQAGECLRNSSHSSTAADLLSARQQLAQYQQQLEERDAEVKGHEERSQQQQQHISQLEQRLTHMHTTGSQAEESLALRLQEKEVLLAEQKRSMAEQEVTLALLREELSTSGQQRAGLSQQLASSTQELQTAKTDLERTQMEVAGTKFDLDRMKTEFEKTQVDLERRNGEFEKTRAELERTMAEFERAQVDLERAKSVAERTQGDLDRSLVDLESTKTELERVMRESQSSKELLDGSSRTAEYESLKMELENNKEEYESLKMELENSKEQYDNLKMELDNSKDESEILKMEIENRKDDYESLKMELENSKEEVESFKMELENSKEELASNRVEMDSNRVELDANEAELDSLRVELENLKMEHERKRAELETELDTSKAELESSKVELSSSRQKERLSSAEIQQLMGAVEDLQRRCHRGDMSESELVQRAEEEGARRLELLRGELDEMYGEQIVTMKQELRLQHAAELQRVTQQHAEEVERMKLSCGEANQLSARLVELQQKLQESSVLRDRACQDAEHLGQEKLALQERVNALLQELDAARKTAAAAAAGAPSNAQERHQAEAASLHDTVSELRAQLAEAMEASVEQQAKHEAEVTNYRIKLEMLEREKDAVLDAMAESQEAELERLRTSLLFSHEEELGKLREELTQESQLHQENLRQELQERHAEEVRRLGGSHDALLRQAEHEKADLAEERDALLGEMEALKEELSRAVAEPPAPPVAPQRASSEEVIAMTEERLREMQGEIQELRERERERAEEEERREALLRDMQERQESWENQREALENQKEALEADNEELKQQLDLMSVERKEAQDKMAVLSADNESVRRQVDELQREAEQQRNTFSFAERNFQVNYQELKEECTCLAREKAALEERGRHDTLDYEAKLNSLRSEIQELRTCAAPSHKPATVAQDGGASMVEKDATELMEKLQTSEKERQRLAEGLREREAGLKEKEVELKKMEVELRATQEEMRAVSARMAEFETDRAAETLTATTLSRVQKELNSETGKAAKRRASTPTKVQEALDLETDRVAETLTAIALSKGQETLEAESVAERLSATVLSNVKETLLQMQQQQQQKRQEKRQKQQQQKQQQRSPAPSNVEPDTDRVAETLTTTVLSKVRETLLQMQQQPSPQSPPPPSSSSTSSSQLPQASTAPAPAKGSLCGEEEQTQTPRPLASLESELESLQSRLQAAEQERRRAEEEREEERRREEEQRFALQREKDKLATLLLQREQELEQAQQQQQPVSQAPVERQRERESERRATLPSSTAPHSSSSSIPLSPLSAAASQPVQSEQQRQRQQQQQQETATEQTLSTLQKEEGEKQRKEKEKEEEEEKEEQEEEEVEERREGSRRRGGGKRRRRGMQKRQERSGDIKQEEGSSSVSVDGGSSGGGHGHGQTSSSPISSSSSSFSAAAPRGSVAMHPAAGDHTECMLQLEAQRLSLSQIHEAQLELERERLQQQAQQRLHSMEQELQRLQTAQTAYQVETGSVKYQNVIQAISDECKQVIQSFVSLLGEELVQSLPAEAEEKGRRGSSGVGRGEKKKEKGRRGGPTSAQSRPTDPGALLQEAKDLCNSLYQLRDNITQEYTGLQELQTTLKDQGHKVSSLQQAYEELKRTSEEEISDLRTRLHSGTTALEQGAADHTELDQRKQARTQTQTAAPTKSDSSSGSGAISDSETLSAQRLREEFREQQAQLEQRHLVEIERLRTYYQQQAEETQERYATELILLQQKIHELSDTPLPFSLPSGKGHPPQRREEGEDYKLEEHEEEAAASVRSSSASSSVVSASSSSAGLPEQLASLRQALSHKYLQEVTALKEQHRAELERLRRGRRAGEEDEEEEEEGEETQRHSVVNGELQRRRGEKLTHSQESMEEEVAKVIVQMSVEFAQQSELSRLAKQLENEEENEDEHMQYLLRRQSQELQELREQLRTSAARGPQPAQTRLPPITIKEDEEEEEEEKEEEMSWRRSARSSRGGDEEDQTKEEVSVCSGSEVLLEELQRELGLQEEEHRRALEELRETHARQLEEQRDQQTQLSTRLQRLHTQLQQREAAEMREEDGESGRRGGRGASQTIATQTEQRLQQGEEEEEKEQEEEEGRKEKRSGKRRGRGRREKASSGVTSPEPQDASSPDVNAERNLLRKANERLRQVLSDVLKTTVAAEETIGRHVEGLLLDPSSRGQHPTAAAAAAAAAQQQPPHRPTWQKPPEGFKPYSTHSAGAGDGSSDSCHGSETAVSAGDDAASVWSGETEVDEGLEMSQQMAEGSLARAAGKGAGDGDVSLENEEYLATLSSRLQAAVETLLLAITDTTNQLEHARVTQTELMRESFRHSEEVQDLLRRQEELQERLGEEANAREQLALELTRAEGLIDGYTGERAGLEAQVRLKEELRQQLEQELQVTSSRLAELEEERHHMQQERELLTRQQDAMKDQAGPRELRLVEAAVLAAPEADLLEETEKLMKEKVDVQRQAEKESSALQRHLKAVECELEEQTNRLIETEQAHGAETHDLRQQIQALEKQLDKNRKFLDEQAVDREHERDVFQQEILKLEQQLKNPPKSQTASEQRDREVESLRSQLHEKSDWCSELLLRGEQLEREAAERDEELERLGERVRQLEQALLSSTEQVEESRQHAPMTESDRHGNRQHAPMGDAERHHGSLEAQLQTEREALDRKEKEICNLEEQLEQFREELENKSEEVQQLHMQLEIQRKEITSQQEEMEAKAQLMEVVELKDREMALLTEQLAKLQNMEVAPDNKVMEQRGEQVLELESQVEILRSEQQRLKRSSEEEVDQLHAVIEKLQLEIANIGHQRPPHPGEEEEDDEEDEDEQRGSFRKDELHEMKQRMDEVSRELHTLKDEHRDLQLRYGTLVEAGASTERTTGLLQEALWEKTASLVVAQAEVQALEESASSRVEALTHQVVELEASVQEKDLELDVCRVKVERAQSEASGLQQRIVELEERLREKVAAVLASQAQLGALQTQTKEEVEFEELGGLTSMGPMGDYQLPNFSFSPMPSASLSHATASTHTRGKMGFLTEKLRELEVGLCGMQKDQELQKQLLSSSEEEVMEYERRLAVLMELLNQMKTKPRATLSQAGGSEASEASISELVQELREAQEKARAAEEELTGFRQHSHQLQQEIQIKDLSISQLQEDLKEASEGGAEQVASGSGVVVQELREELSKVRKDASSANQELSLLRERSDTLQEDLLAREMTIAQLKDKLYRASGGGDEGSVSELLQELQEVREEASSTKEELNSYRERSEKLQEEVQQRDASISQLQQEVHRLQTTLATLEERQADEARQALKSPPQGLKSPPHSLKSPPQQQKKSQQQHPPPSQPKRKGSKPEQKGKGGSSSGGDGGGGVGKDKPPLSRKSSAAALSERSLSTSSSNGTGSRRSSGAPQDMCADAATQTDLMPTDTTSSTPGMSQASASEEVAEVIGEYQEKIVQMQELHAAEIMDMETRHISESDALRRDVQVLEDECKTLKAVIDKLRSSSEAMSSRQEQSVGPQFKDGYTSDSSSDWSQRTGLEHHQEMRSTPEGARRDAEGDAHLPDRIKSLLREVHQEGMQVLSLSELPLGMGGVAEGAEMGVGVGAPAHLMPPGALQGWSKEREALLGTVEALKGLLAKMQTHTETQGDWRADLLGAVQQVFQCERNVLKSALYSQLEMLDTSDAVIYLNQLEHRLKEQDTQHREAMGALHAADRSSLLSEVSQLRAQMELLGGTRETAATSPFPWQQASGAWAGPVSGPDVTAAGPHQQEQERGRTQAGGHAQAPGLQTGATQPGQMASGGVVVSPGDAQTAVSGGQEHQHQHQHQHQLLEEMKAELAQTKLELETTLKAQHKHLKELDTLRSELTQKAGEVDSLSDRLAEEQRGARELQWALEKEKCRSDKKEEGEREEMEDLKLALSEQQARVSELSSRLEEEQQQASRLRTQSQETQRQQEAQLAQQHSRAKELEVQLESQQARADELQGALLREREVGAQLRHQAAASSQSQTSTSPAAAAADSPDAASPEGVTRAEEGCTQVEAAVSSMESMLASMQAEVEVKQGRVVQLLGDLEAQRLETVQQGARWNAERADMAQRTAQDQQALEEVRGELERLAVRLEEAEGRLEGERERGQRLERERQRLQERVEELSQAAANAAPNQHTAWREGEMGEVVGGDRTRDWVLQQKSDNGLTIHSSTPSIHEHHGPTGTPAAVAIATEANISTSGSGGANMDAVVQRLQLIASKIRGITSDASNRLSGDEVSRESLSWLQGNVNDVITMLQQSPLPLATTPAPEGSPTLVGGGSSAVLTERLLRQNAELTGFVSRLTEEKNELRNQLLRLEDELRRLRLRGLASDSSSRKGDGQELAVLGVEREAWGRERSRLEKSLRHAEAEVTRLKGDMRNDTLRDMSGPDSDNMALKRMYGRYLRAESFRKALVYQKKYLLLLLGGFQECEEATLALIARMGGHPSPACIETISHRRRGFTRFRSAVRVSIALSRMRFLVKRWQKATGSGSGSGSGTLATLSCVNRNGLSQTTGVEGRHESAFLHPGGVEVFGERRGVSRGRTGRDSPRGSTLSTQQRYHGISCEPGGGGTPCSHLLNYDPDRALTDYIARLEALQRRLGSVQSGTSSYAQLHYGIRR